MAAQPQSRVRLAFGPFEVHTEAAELRKRGIRVRLSGQPFQILLVLLAHPGEVVTREQLREEVWVAGTFVDFEHGLNAAMNKLRRALSDSPENPRYIETLAGRGYRLIGTLERARPTAIPHVIESFVPEQPVVPRNRHPWWLLGSVAACFISFAVGWQLHDPPAPLPSWTLTRLTADPGLSEFNSQRCRLVASYWLIRATAARRAHGIFTSNRFRVGSRSASRLMAQATLCRISRPTAARSYFGQAATAAAFTRFRRLAVRCDYWRGRD